LPFLVTAILTALFIVGVNEQGGGDEALRGWLQILGIGFYMTAIASLLLAFAGGKN
jgi:hypothetical protein